MLPFTEKLHGGLFLSCAFSLSFGLSVSRLSFTLCLILQTLLHAVYRTGYESPSCPQIIHSYSVCLMRYTSNVSFCTTRHEQSRKWRKLITYGLLLCAHLMSIEYDLSRKLYPWFLSPKHPRAQAKFLQLLYALCNIYYSRGISVCVHRKSDPICVWTGTEIRLQLERNVII